MRVLIFHMRFHPDLTGTAPLVTDLATFLTARGEDVTVVTSMPHYGRKAVSEAYRGKWVSRERFRGVEVFRTFVYVPPNPKGYHRALNYLSYNFMSVLAGFRAEPPDVILCINPPITVGFSGWLVKLFHDAPLVYDVQDIWPDCIVIIGQLRNPLLIRIFKFLERFIYRKSACVKVLSSGMRQNLLRKGGAGDKIRIVPNWVDTGFIRPLPKDNSFRSTYGSNHHFIVQFAGNIGFNSMLENVLEAAAFLKSDPRVLFMIIGEGNAKKGLVAKASSLSLNNVKFITTQPQPVLPEMLAAADVSLVTLNRHLGELNVPSKTFSIMAAARPVIASVPKSSEIAHVVKEAACGIRVRPEDPKAIVAAIEYLSNNPDQCTRYGNNGRIYAEKHYSRYPVMGVYHRLLKEVATQS